MSIAPHYSPAIRSGDFIFTSGQLPILDPMTKALPEGIKAQTELVLKKVEDILVSYDLSKDHIIKTTAYITDVGYWGIVNEVYAAFFGSYKPARTILPVAHLHYGCLIELEAVASFTRPI